MNLLDARCIATKISLNHDVVVREPHEGRAIATRATPTKNAGRCMMNERPGRMNARRYDAVRWARGRADRVAKAAVAEAAQSSRASLRAAATGSPVMRKHTLARCRSCKALFIPVSWLAWRVDGYCSARCLASVLGGRVL